MRRFLLNAVLALPPFRGRHRIVSAIRSYCYAPYQRRMTSGLLLELDVHEWAQLHLAEHGVTEPETMALLERLLKPGDSCIDVGAHVGFVTLVARQAVGAEGCVIAVEPQPYNCERILRNWEINGFTNLQLHVAAAGPNQGFVKLFQQAATDKSRLSLALPMPDALALEFEVPMITVGDLITKYGLASVQVLKIDVEGFELGVLEGLADGAGVVRNIIFEALSPTGTGGDAASEWLTERGFSLRTVTGEPWDGAYPVRESNLWATRV